MDARFHNLGFAANPKSNAFKDLCNSIQIGAAGAEVVYCADTTLRLDSAGFETPFISAPKGIKRKWSSRDGPMDLQVGSSLGVQLGHSSSSSDSKGSSTTACTSMSSAKESEEESSMDLELDFSLHLGGDKSSGSEKLACSNLRSLDVFPKVDLQLSLSCGPTASDITTVSLSSNERKNITEVAGEGAGKTDGGLTGSTFSPWLNEQNVENISFLNQWQIKPASLGLSSSVITPPQSSVTCTSGITQPQQQRTSSTQRCQFQGCVKGARGASGFCIAHNGGRRCQRPGCQKGAEGRTAFCKAHGGGRRCEFLGCTKSAEGRTELCIAHGGGRSCSHEGCTRAARGKSGLCIRHGGGKRCQKENCTNSAEGASGLCISHGGGPRCQYPECNKGAQGSTTFCKAHGGGKRCTYLGCNEGAEGSTLFCKGHGGGKRCSFQGGGICPKSVHGGTLFCVAHGGGKDVLFKSVQRVPGDVLTFVFVMVGARDAKLKGVEKVLRAALIFARPMVEEKDALGVILILNLVKDLKGKQSAELKQISTDEDMSVDLTMMENNALSSTSSWNYFSLQHANSPVGSNPSLSPFPEGRVHGGNLMAMLAGSSEI
ncbi:UNVERIFIED_CONTAM: hypothetical protein Scaly_0869400 [Sesamum calycinum]|uniref:WRKY19-like zinc finger domain-containing protein n=1 Tax=Sesamum calycinum TaxID=2727403 RepID=A0AAW2QVT9_9LAMI